MSEDVVYMVACRTCGALQQIETVATEWLDGRPVSWEHRCAICKTAFGIMLDGGELDLGLAKDADLNPDNDFVVFTEEPWHE